MEYLPGLKQVPLHASQMLSVPEKVKTVTWSQPAVGTCPAVNEPIIRALDAARKRGLRASQVNWEGVLSEIPPKCPGCYAFDSGHYSEMNVIAAQHRHWAWFQDSPDEEVVDKLVRAIADSGRMTCTYEPVSERSPWKPKWSKDGRKILGAERKPKTDCHYKSSSLRKKEVVLPDRFRLFDSGDFSSPRDVRIWGEVIRRLAAYADRIGQPRIRWWIPTTAWMDKCGLTRGIREELVKLKRIDPDHVVIRPSGHAFDRAAPRVPGLDFGTAVVTWQKETIACPRPMAEIKGYDPETLTKIDKHGRKKKCTTVRRRLSDMRRSVYIEDDAVSLPKTIDLPDEHGRPVAHFVCRGDCGACPGKGQCWRNSYPVAYIQHGPDVDDVQSAVDKVRDQAMYVEKVLKPQYWDLGPDGVHEDRLSAREFLRSEEFRDRYVRHARGGGRHAPEERVQKYLRYRKRKGLR